MRQMGTCEHFEDPDDIECEYCNAYPNCELHHIRLRVLKLKQYHNCTLWASFTEQPNGHTIAYACITATHINVTNVHSHMWTPLLWLSGGDLQSCRQRVIDTGHALIMRQLMATR